MATVVADYDEGCQVIISATMCNDTQLGEVIRGRLGDDQVHRRRRLHEGLRGVRAEHRRRPGQAEGARLREADPQLREPEQDRATRPTPCGRTSWTACMADKERARRSARRNWAPRRSATVNMGVQSYRYGKVLFWDKEKRATKDADASWASAVGSPQQEARQAEPDHRLERRRQGQHARAAGLPEARRPVGRRQGPGSRLVFGVWCLVFGVWCLVFGVQIMVVGLALSLVCG